MTNKKYKIRVVRGAFQNPDILDKMGAKTIEKFDSEWIGLDEVVADVGQVRELQQDMTRHFDNQTVPWYMDGYIVDDPKEYIVAFSGDDGEGGKLFQFRLDDKDALAKVVEYGLSKGIPVEQLDFMDIKF